MTKKTNLLFLKSYPFKKPIIFFQYISENEDKIYYPQVGFIVKTLRRINKSNIIFHQGKKIWAFNEISQKSSEFLENYNLAPNMQKIELNKKNLPFLEKFLSEIIGFTLRNTYGNWRILDKGTYYQAIYQDQIEKIDKVLVCRAFDFTPFIFSDGTAAIAILPKYRLYMDFTLKDINLKDRWDDGKFLVDYCPIICDEKDDPYTNCKLSIPDSIGSKENAEIIKMKPSDCKFINYRGKKVNLIEFSNDRLICQKKKLGAIIQNKAPVIQIKKIVKNEIKTYNYPLERLRFSYDFRFLENNLSKRKINNILYQDPEQKFSLYSSVCGLFDNIDIFQGKESISFDIEHDVKTIQQYVFIEEMKTTSFRLFGKSTTYPQSRIKKFGPFDKNLRKMNKIQIFVVSLGSLNKKIKSELKKFFINSRINLFLKKFEIDIEISDFIELNDNKDIEGLDSKINSRINNDGNYCLISIYKKGKESLRNKLRKNLIEKNIPYKGVHYETLNNEKNLWNKLFNIFLSLYSKIGGVPWRIDTNKDNIIIGFQKLYSENKIYYIIVCWNSHGKYITGTCGSLNKENFKSDIVGKLNQLISNLVYDRLLILGFGTQTDIKDSLISNLKTSSLDYGYYEIKENTNIRFFDDCTDYVNSLKSGSYVKIREEYYLQSTKFENRTPSTFKIKKIKESLDSYEDLQEIYNFSVYNPYYSGKYSSKLPLPLHCTSKAIYDIKKFNLDILKIKTPWFY